MGDAPGAEATLFHAVAAADVAGDDATRAEAWVRLMSAANDQAKPDAATVFDEQARAALERLGGDATIDAWRQIFLATALRNRGQFGEARLEYEGALTLCERAFGPGSQAEASALGGLGNVYAAVGDYEAAAGMLRRSAEITEAAAYYMHRATAARWVADARERLLEGVRQRLKAKLRLSEADLESVMALARSQLDVSVRRLLRDDGG